MKNIQPEAGDEMGRFPRPGCCFTVQKFLHLPVVNVSSNTEQAHPEIPQLWNMRGNSRVKLKNGRLIDMVTGPEMRDIFAMCLSHHFMMATWSNLVLQIGHEDIVNKKVATFQYSMISVSGVLFRFGPCFAGGQSSLQAIYGGVEFGLDRFELAQRHALQGQPGMQLGQSGGTKFGSTWADLSLSGT